MTKSQGNFYENIWTNDIHVAYIREIKNMYDGAKIRIMTVGGYLGHFSVVMGLHRRTTLSHFYLPWRWMYLHATFKGRCHDIYYLQDIIRVDEVQDGINTRLDV